MKYAENTPCFCIKLHIYTKTPQKSCCLCKNLILLLVIIGVVYALHEHFAVVGIICEGAVE